MVHECLEGYRAAAIDMLMFSRCLLKWFICCIPSAMIRRNCCSASDFAYCCPFLCSVVCLSSVTFVHST